MVPSWRIFRIAWIFINTYQIKHCFVISSIAATTGKQEIFPCRLLGGISVHRNNMLHFKIMTKYFTVTALLHG